MKLSEHVRTLILLSALTALPQVLQAAEPSSTLVQKRLSQLTRLTPLRKVTVGPDDQYQGTWDPAANRLIFTRKSDLAPHLCVQDRESGKIRPLLGQNADSQDATLNSKGAIAFTYFKQRSTGDICFLPPGFQPVDTLDQSPKELRCLANKDSYERSNPFWKNDREIGYLLHDSSTGIHEVWSESVDSGERTLLARGKIWSPTVSPSGKWLAYSSFSEGTDKIRVLVLQDLTTGSKKEFRFELPGTSGFPEFTDNESHLIFSHYLNDTNRDGIIDGNDNSVLFRVSLSAAGQADLVLPEQLTSIETNCSYPTFTRGEAPKILATCAFEGTLDLYELPATGVVPPQWTEAQIRNAHQSARTYGERILLLNTLRSRFPKTWNRTLEEQLFSNHYFAGDVASARFYAGKLGKTHALLDLLLEAVELKQTQPTEEITRGLIAEILRIDGEIERQPKSRLRELTRGHLRMLLGRATEAASFLNSALSLKSTRDEDLILALDLARWTSLQKGSPSDRVIPDFLMTVYLQSFQSELLSEESRIAAAFDFLRVLAARVKSSPERRNWISKALSALEPKGAPSIRSLLESEKLTLEICEAESEENKTKLYPQLDRQLSEARSHYFLRKAIGTRAIVNFAEAADFLRMGFVATQWLRFTPDSDTEFTQAREVYAISSLEHGYDRLGKNQIDLASNYFYSSVSLTDDLESHAGYIHAMSLKNAIPTLKERYQNLKERGTVLDNQKFADALLSLEGTSSLDRIDAAIQNLESMTQDRDHALRYLYLGSLYLEKLIRTASGYDFSLSFSELAHRNLMLAYDLGRDNDRIKSSALLNLAYLHSQIQNHGLATQFYAKRSALPFLKQEDQDLFIWKNVESLIKSYQSEEATKLLTLHLNSPEWKGRSPQDRLPFEERLAFAQLVSQKWSDAAAAYRALLKKNLISDDSNLARIQLAYGSALFKSGKAQEAVPVLKEAVLRASRLKAEPRPQHKLVAFDPRRIQLAGLGFLAQTGSPSERLLALQERESLLRGSKDILDSWNASLAQNLLQQAEILEARDSREIAALKIQEALSHAQDYAKEYQYLAHAVYQTTQAALSFGLLHPQPEKSRFHSELESLVSEGLKAYDRQPFPQATLDLQRLKLEVLWNRYQRTILGRTLAPLDWDKTQHSEGFLRVKNAFPKEAQSLEQLAKAIP